MTKRFDEITLTDVATWPRPGTSVPGLIRFTPDSTAVTFLWSESGSLVRSLYALDPATGERRLYAAAPAGSGDEANLSREERLRRERARLRETGITSYSFAGAADPAVLLVPLRGRLYVRVGDGELRELPDTEGALDAALSRNGRRVAFARDGELWCVDLPDGTPRRLTFDAEDGVANGVADYVAHEELGRSRGFWISRDGGRIAYGRVDERHVPVYPIVHQGTDRVEIEEHRYPFAGERNAIVTLGIVPAAGGETVWADLGAEEDQYLARVAWRPAGDLAVLVLSRDQRSMTWLRIDPATGAATTMVEERGEPWLNLPKGTRFLESGETLTTTERSGVRRLLLLDANGAEIREIPVGEEPVTELLGVDEERRVAYAVAATDRALCRHVFAAPLDGGEAVPLTEGRGWHSAVFSPDCRRWAHTVSRLTAAPRIALRETDGAEVAVIHEDAGATAEALGLAPPRLVTVTADDGTVLNAAVYEPPADGRRHPVLVSVYGGPHAQRVMDEWSLTAVDLRAQALARRGFRVLKVDNRGSANRGLRFEAHLHRAMGTVEIDDQVAAVRSLADRDDVDLDRVGIYGWSYGGYMTLLCLAKRPDVFRAGVAGAPVTDWDGYDTGYTERYMETPAANPDGYREGSVLTHAEKIEGALLLVHGMVDENVHFRHTARLLTRLKAAGKPFESLLLPEERHMPRDRAGLLHLETRIAEFFERSLTRGGSPYM